MNEEKKGGTVFDDDHYSEALRLVESGEESAKTKVAFYKLCGCGGAEIDEEGAVALLEKRLEERDGEAMWMLGLCCEYGIGTKQDIERAELLYEQSHEAGNGVGEFLMNNTKCERATGEMKVHKCFGL